MDIAARSELVAELTARAAAPDTRTVVRQMRERIRVVFHGDARSTHVLDSAIAHPGSEQLRELTAALAWYARRDAAFADELSVWAALLPTGPPATQTIRAGRDAYVAGRDQTIRMGPTDRGRDDGRSAEGTG
ncbi:hypothetical protein AB0B50_27270 [Streptomyces sp. NPDC041068]|uniref:hypothetical protein n=1 Tax=Streptomyces sp. NPDC041068 TaxID=3155130 RepID=UPI0034096B08